MPQLVQKGEKTPFVRLEANQWFLVEAVEDRPKIGDTENFAAKLYSGGSVSDGIPAAEELLNRLLSSPTIVLIPKTSAVKDAMFSDPLESPFGKFWLLSFHGKAKLPNGRSYNRFDILEFQLEEKDLAYINRTETKKKGK